MYAEILLINYKHVNIFVYILTKVYVCRSEVERLRSGNQAKNEQLRAKWLEGSVTELRAEVAELAAGVNRTEELAAREALTEGLRVVRGDVAALRRDLDILRGQTEGEMAQLSERLTDVASQCALQVSSPGVVLYVHVQLTCKRDVHKSQLKGRGGRW